MLEMWFFLLLLYFVTQDDYPSNMGGKTSVVQLNSPRSSQTCLCIDLTFIKATKKLSREHKVQLFL